MVTHLQEDPTSRYHIVTAWNPVDVKLKRAALAPCHNMFQAYTYTDRAGEERLDLQMNQRSADHFLGLGFNPPQYAALTAKIAVEVGVKPGEFIHNIGDHHIYVGSDKRASWYAQEDNLRWLQDTLRKEHPHTVLEDLLKKLPEEEGTPGYDHVPYLLEQLGRRSHAEPPRLRVVSNPLNETEVDDFVVENYAIKQRAEKVLINGFPPRMAS